MRRFIFASIDGNNKAAERRSLRLFAVKTAVLVRVAGFSRRLKNMPPARAKSKPSASGFDLERRRPRAKAGEKAHNTRDGSLCYGEQTI